MINPFMSWRAGLTCKENYVVLLRNSLGTPSVYREHPTPNKLTVAREAIHMKLEMMTISVNED